MNRTHIDLFSGIGGFALACRWAGVETIGFAEIDQYASRVLAKNFPGVTNYGDVRNVPAPYEIDSEVCLCPLNSETTSSVRQTCEISKLPQSAVLTGELKSNAHVAESQNWSHPALQKNENTAPTNADTNTKWEQMALMQMEAIGCEEATIRTGETETATLERKITQEIQMSENGADESLPGITIPVKSAAFVQRSAGNSMLTTLSHGQKVNNCDSTCQMGSRCALNVTGKCTKKHERLFLITAGFPCQPFSVAGKRQGTSDDRWLWNELLSIVRAYKPTWVLLENVYGLVSIESGMVFEQVLSDLETIGYEIQTFVIPAVGVDAPHRRERVWIVGNTSRSRFGGQHSRRTGAQLAHGRENVAYADESDSGRRSIQPQREAQGRIAANGHGENVADTDDAGCTQQWRTITAQPQHASAECGSRWQPEPGIRRVANGIPHRVDRLRGLGNAIVPQVAYQLIRMMIEAEDEHPTD